MNAVRVVHVCGSVELSTNRIMKTTVSVQCSFGLAREVVMGAVKAISVNHADPILILFFKPALV